MNSTTSAPRSRSFAAFLFLAGSASGCLMRNDDFQSLLEQARDEQQTLDLQESATSPLAESSASAGNSDDRQPPQPSSGSTSLPGTLSSSSSSLGASSPDIESGTSSDEPSTSSSLASSSSSSFATTTQTSPKTCVEKLCYESNGGIVVSSLYLVDFSAFAVLFPRDNRVMRVTRVEYYTGYVFGRHDVQIHENSDGRPGTVKGSGQFQASIVQGWQGTQISPPVEMSSANPHWISWKPRTGALGSMASIFGGQDIHGLDRGTFNPDWSNAARPLKMRVHCCNY